MSKSVYITPVVRAKLLNRTKNRTLVTCMLSNINKMAYFYAACAVCVTIFSTTLLLKSPVLRLLMRLHRGAIILTNVAVYYFISLQRTAVLFQ